MNRITEKMLNNKIKYLNELTNNCTESYSFNGERYVANIGNFHLYQAYGLCALEQMVSNGGGVNQIIGLTTRRDLYNLIGAYIRGIELAKIIF